MQWKKNWRNNFQTFQIWPPRQQPVTWDNSSSRLSPSISSPLSTCLSQRFCLSLSCCFSLAYTHPVEGLLDTVSESLNSTWQGVASSNAANVTVLLRSQAEGGENNESSHLAFDIKDDILLIFFLLPSLLTSLDIKRLAGYLLQLCAHSANGRFFKEKGKDGENRTRQACSVVHEICYNTSFGS